MPQYVNSVCPKLLGRHSGIPPDSIPSQVSWPVGVVSVFALTTKKILSEGFPYPLTGRLLFSRKGEYPWGWYAHEVSRSRITLKVGNGVTQQQRLP